MKIIVINSFKGGVGKSFVTTETARALVRKGYSVTVIDLDMTTPNMEEIDGVTLIKGMLNVTPSSRDIKRLIRQAKNSKSDYILIDTPPTVNAVTLTLVDNVIKPKPQFLYVTTPSKNAVKDTAQGIRFFTARGGYSIGIVQNMIGDDFGQAIDSERELLIPTVATIELSDKQVDQKFDSLVEILELATYESSIIESEKKIMSKVTVDEIKASYSNKAGKYGIPLRFYNLDTWDWVRKKLIEKEELATTSSGSTFFSSRYDVSTGELEKVLSLGDYVTCMVREDLAVEGTPPRLAIEEMKVYWGHPHAKGLPMFIAKSSANLWLQEVSILNENEFKTFFKDMQCIELEQGKYISGLYHFMYMFRAFTRFTTESEIEQYKKYIKYTGKQLDKREFYIYLLVLEGILSNELANKALEDGSIELNYSEMNDDFNVEDFLGQYDILFEE